MTKSDKATIVLSLIAIVLALVPWDSVIHKETPSQQIIAADLTRRGAPPIPVAISVSLESPTISVGTVPGTVIGKVVAMTMPDGSACRNCMLAVMDERFVMSGLNIVVARELTEADIGTLSVDLQVFWGNTQ